MSLRVLYLRFLLLCFTYIGVSMFETKVNSVVIPYSPTFPVFSVSRRLDRYLSRLATVMDTEFAGYLDTLSIKTLYKPKFNVIMDVPSDFHDILMPVNSIYVGFAKPIFPKQHASLGEVEVDEPQPHQVFFHKHPSGINDFSSIDNQYLLPQFDANLLITRDGIAQMTYRIPVDRDGFNAFVIVKACRDSILFIDDVDDNEVEDVSDSLSMLNQNLQRQTYQYQSDDWYKRVYSGSKYLDDMYTYGYGNDVDDFSAKKPRKHYHDSEF